MVTIMEPSLKFDKQIVEKGLAVIDVPMLLMIVSLMLLVDCTGARRFARMISCDDTCTDKGRREDVVNRK
jgi:hypothetical protein